MTLETLKNAPRVIGVKQVMKAVSRSMVQSVFVAVDADDIDTFSDVIKKFLIQS